MKERTTLTMYIITKWTLEYQNQDNPEEGIQMKIILKRRIINELLTSYLPSVLLILISYSTTFFRPCYFEASVTVNLTSMLVMTTIFIAVMDKLPSTAYIKMIDIWLIFGQLIPFARVVITTVMEQMRNVSDRMVNHHGSAMQLDAADSPINVIGIAGMEEKLTTRQQLKLAATSFFLEGGGRTFCFSNNFNCAFGTTLLIEEDRRKTTRIKSSRCCRRLVRSYIFFSGVVQRR